MPLPLPIPDDQPESHWALNTTVRCQHRCVYCFEGKREGLSDVAADSTKRLIDEAARVAPAVIFMGAEPTLNPALPELIRYAAGKGLRTSISTNALRLANRDFLSQLLDAGLGFIELSFHYPDEKVYAAITRAHPRGFARLLQAMENIDALCGAAPLSGRRAVNVNLVASRYNVQQLARVVEHVSTRLLRTPHQITIKRVTRPSTLSLSEFVRNVSVPCSQLSERFVSLVTELGGNENICFRDFPLCVLPGLERLDADLRCWLNGTVVFQNFEDQTRAATMYPEPAMRTEHAYQWICDRCSLDPVCLRRGLFEPPIDDENFCPIAAPSDLPEPLRAWISHFPRGAAALENRQATVARSGERGWLLKHLAPASLRLSPRQPGANWIPLTTGMLLVVDGERSLRVSVGLASAQRPCTWQSGVWTVDPVNFPPDVEAPAPIAKLLEALLAIPEPAFASDSTITPGAAGSHRTPARRRPERLRAADEAWSAFIGGPLLSSVRHAAANHPSMRPEQVEGTRDDAILMRLTRFIALVRVLPREGPASEGFLCGGVRVQIPVEALHVARDQVCVALVLRVCRSFSDQERWPDVWPYRPCTFLREAWQVFGGALLPRRGARGSLLRGRVSHQLLRLAFKMSDGAEFNLVIRPRSTVDAPVAASGSIALQYDCSNEVAEHPDLRQIVGHYADRLRSCRGGLPAGAAGRND